MQLKIFLIPKGNLPELLVNKTKQNQTTFQTCTNQYNHLSVKDMRNFDYNEKIYLSAADETFSIKGKK